MSVLRRVKVRDAYPDALAGAQLDPELVLRAMNAHYYTASLDEGGRLKFRVLTDWGGPPFYLRRFVRVLSPETFAQINSNSHVRVGRSCVNAARWWLASPRRRDIGTVDAALVAEVETVAELLEKIEQRRRSEQSLA